LNLKILLLAGWSFGGVVAFEVARQLLDIGRPVKGLLLIDAPYPRNHKPLPNSVIDVIVPQSKSSSRQEITRQFRHCAALLADYDCPPTSRLPNTKVVALKSAQVLDTRSLYGVSYPWLSSQSARDAAIRQWEELLEQEITVLDIQGDHFQAFDPENVRIILTLCPFLKLTFHTD
jgi:thioesterase domain-containing protein